MVCLAQTVHLSCTDNNTVSKQTEMRFHMTHVTLEHQRVCPKRFLSLCYVRREPCTYLASKLALSPNEPKQAFSWALSPSSTIGCVQNNLWAYGMFGANCAPILHRYIHCLQTDRNMIPRDPHYLGVTSGASKIIFERMVHLAKLCTYLAPTLTLSLNRPKQDSTWPTSPRSSIRCI
jgi:hypothetical protein